MSHETKNAVVDQLNALLNEHITRLGGPISSALLAARDEIRRQDTSVAELELLLNEVAAKSDRLQKKLDAARDALESIVCTGGCDAGVVLLSHDGPTHTDQINGETVQVYDHEYFSPLGDALIGLYQLVGGKVEED